MRIAHSTPTASFRSPAARASAPAPSSRPDPSVGKNPATLLAHIALEHRSWLKASHRSQAHPMPWPAGFEPSKSPVFAHNEVFIPLPPSAVFAGLVDAARWPKHLGNAGKIDVRSGAGPSGSLQLGTKYHWSFGEKLKNEVTLFQKDRAIGWVADGTGSMGFHRWILEAVPGGTRLITEETQHGLVPRLSNKAVNPMLHGVHQWWLQSLKEQLLADRAAGRKPNDLN